MHLLDTMGSLEIFPYLVFSNSSVKVRWLPNFDSLGRRTCLPFWIRTLFRALVAYRSPYVGFSA